jgi:putative serine/threonine protein kinase
MFSSGAGLVGLSDIIPLGALLESHAGFLLSYPLGDPERGRVVRGELELMGVSALIFKGRHAIDGVPILGKGHVGIVVVGLLDGEEVAIKLRRADADRASMEAEGKYLRVANGVSVGPQLLGVSPEVLAMELVEGDYLVDWVGGLEPGDAGLLRGLLVDLMEQACRLDIAGLDHGELSNARRHVIVSGSVGRIVDFESASVSRRCSNVTSMAQYLFFNRRMAGGVEGVLSLPDRDSLVGALSAYRWWPGEASFRRVLAASDLVE